MFPWTLGIMFPVPITLDPMSHVPMNSGYNVSCTHDPGPNVSCFHKLYAQCFLFPWNLDPMFHVSMTLCPIFHVPMNSGYNVSCTHDPGPNVSRNLYVKVHCSLKLLTPCSLWTKCSQNHHLELQWLPCYRCTKQGMLSLTMFRMYISDNNHFLYFHKVKLTTIKSLTK